MMKDVNYTSKDTKWIFRYFKTEMKSVRRAVDKVAKTNSEAVSKVETNNANYRATQNEWRGQIKDERALLATRVELDSLRAQLSANSKFMNMVVGGLIVLQFILLAALSIWLKK